MIDLAPPPAFKLPKPAIIHVGEPWERRLDRDLAARGIPLGMRLAVIAELRRLQGMRGSILRPAIADLERYARLPLAMLPGMAVMWGGEKAAAFPVVAAVNSNAQGTGSNNKVVNLPAGIASGDLLLALCAQVENAFGTAPTGWNQLHSVSGSSQISLQLCYRVADGSEGASVTFAGNSIRRSAHLSMRITGFQGAPESQITASTTSAAPNPPSLTPSWGAANTLWISMFAVFISATNPVTGYPANYANGFSIENSPATSPSALVAASWRELNAASENPGAAAITNSAPWRAITIGIRPA